jgi:hypothetical protein
MTDLTARMWAALACVTAERDALLKCVGIGMDQQADACAAVAREVRAEALREAARELEVNWGHKATPEMRDAILALIDTPQAEAETCQDCMGTGISGHPDSGYTCYRCNGDGAVALIDAPEPARRETGPLTDIHGMVAGEANAPDLRDPDYPEWLADQPAERHIYDGEDGA